MKNKKRIRVSVFDAFFGTFIIFFVIFGSLYIYASENEEGKLHKKFTSWGFHLVKTSKVK